MQHGRCGPCSGIGSIEIEVDLVSHLFKSVKVIVNAFISLVFHLHSCMESQRFLMCLRKCMKQHSSNSEQNKGLHGDLSNAF